jgi:hypothetical protein
MPGHLLRALAAAVVSGVGKTVWSAEPFLWPGEIASERLSGWVSREVVADPEEAITLAARELGVPRERITLAPVLMREESEVEARINGHEFPQWVECTARAKSPERFWRVTHDA